MYSPQTHTPKPCTPHKPTLLIYALLTEPRTRLGQQTPPELPLLLLLLLLLLLRRWLCGAGRAM